MSKRLLLVSWAMTWEKSAVYALTPTITSMFQANNISGVLTTVLSTLQTVLQPMYSKLSDMTGRALHGVFYYHGMRSKLQHAYSKS